MSCLVEHYERQITLNATVIADTYESLDKIEGWSEREKQQLEEEVKSIIDGKGQMGPFFLEINLHYFYRILRTIKPFYIAGK